MNYSDREAYKLFLNSVYGLSSSSSISPTFKDLIPETMYNELLTYKEKQMKFRNTINLSENLQIKKVIFNEPATIVFWSDGSKTVVKCGENDFYDHEKGLAMCIVKRFLGNKGNYYNKLRKWLDMYDKGENNE